MLHVKGSQSAPVEGHQLVGVSVTHTAPIFLKTYMASLSGGDWSLRPTGAVILEGTIKCLVWYRFYTQKRSIYQDRLGTNSRQKLRQKVIVFSYWKQDKMGDVRLQSRHFFLFGAKNTHLFCDATLYTINDPLTKTGSGRSY